MGKGQLVDNSINSMFTNGLRPLDVKVGDKVLFGQYAGQTVKIDGEELLIMKESDVLGVLE